MIALTVAAALLVVLGVLAYIWRHRTGKAARGIAAAGITYNELYGQGRPPEMPSAASPTTPEGEPRPHRNH